jgi:hypothetical protein
MGPPDGICAHSAHTQPRIVLLVLLVHADERWCRHYCSYSSVQYKQYIIMHLNDFHSY